MQHYRIWLKTLLPAAGAALLLIAAACGGGGGDKGPSPQAADHAGADQGQVSAHSSGDGAPSGALVADIQAAMGKSVEAMRSNVESVLADFKFAMNMGAMNVGASGEFRFQGPDQMYMAMRMDGGQGSLDLGSLGDVEVLALGDTLYMNSALTGWLKMSFAEMGADAATFQGWMEGHSPFDYAALVEKVGGNIQALGTDQIDGKTYAHFQVTIDLADILKAFSEALGSTGGSVASSAFPQGISAPVVMDIWVDPATLLPRRLAANGELNINGQPAAMTLEFNFREYNTPVAIPEAPAGARSFADLIPAPPQGGGGQ